MGGFKNDSLNTVFYDSVLNIIITHLIKCSKRMNAFYAASNTPLENDEDIITNRLVHTFLNAEPNAFRYEPQKSEHFDETTGRYIGRADITVISGDYFNDAKAYHIIECKRIDGSKILNRKYVSEGVSRFLSPVASPKYSSFYRQNIMFGYVVKTIDIPSNTKKLEELQKQILGNGIAGDFLLAYSHDSDYYVYSCEYKSNVSYIELMHLFYDFADAIF